MVTMVTMMVLMKFYNITNVAWLVVELRSGKVRDSGNNEEPG